MKEKFANIIDTKALSCINFKNLIIFGVVRHNSTEDYFRQTHTFPHDNIVSKKIGTCKL